MINVQMNTFIQMHILAVNNGGPQKVRRGPLVTATQLQINDKCPFRCFIALSICLLHTVSMRMRFIFYKGLLLCYYEGTLEPARTWSQTGSNLARIWPQTSCELVCDQVGTGSSYLDILQTVTLGVANAHGAASVANDVIMRMTS